MNRIMIDEGHDVRGPPDLFAAAADLSADQALFTTMNQRKDANIPSREGSPPTDQRAQRFSSYLYVTTLLSSTMSGQLFHDPFSTPAITTVRVNSVALIGLAMDFGVSSEFFHAPDRCYSSAKSFHTRIIHIMDNGYVRWDVFLK